ncbi:hypothetical protein J2S13_000794 [Oikeobacillus pervagus]|uniref:Uncharacterized protein n=1 Tax=Oikeobacillus pervagus TaxID=1325931 RepID=A0AAJ1WIG4_9BACI|nr:hypothetical protein [Oikeobacillus pervagus]
MVSLLWKSVQELTEKANFLVEKISNLNEP